MANPNWVKGVSGNPKGRPPRQRELTELLKKAGKRTFIDRDGHKRSYESVFMRNVWEFVATGSCRFPDGLGGEKTLQPRTFDEWFAAIQWIFNHVDGPPKLEMDVTTGDEPIGAIEASLSGMASLLALYDALRARQVAQDDADSVPGDLAAADRTAG